MHCLMHIKLRKYDIMCFLSATRHCPPICPVSVQINTDCPNGAILSWSPSPNLQNSSKSVYVLERQEVGSQDWQRCMTTETGTTAEILCDSVPCEGDFRFRVCCVNKYGRSGHVEFPKAIHLGKSEISHTLYHLIPWTVLPSYYFH